MIRLRWGLIGGGRDSQIGPTHRIAAAADGHFTLAAGALDADADAGRDFAVELGIASDRAYGDWREMIVKESKRDDRLDLVTVATPNATHYEITKALLGEGFNVLCEKPMTITVAEGEDIARMARDGGLLCAVNFGYTGYSLVRQMRAMVARGDLGRLRLVVAEFAHGHHADRRGAENPRIRWRYDPAEGGKSGVLADAGIHALHMMTFVTGLRIQSLSADFASCVEGRKLEDDAMVNLRFAGRIVGRLWTSAVAIGRQHGLTLQVFGEKGGLRWAQEQPNQLFWTPLDGRTEIIERGSRGLSAEAVRASRLSAGHAEGMPLAVANLYADMATAIRTRKQQGHAAATSEPLHPTAEDGLHMVAVVDASVESARRGCEWVTVL